jgi:hypothetical protein
MKDVTAPNVTFMLAGRTDAISIALARKTPSGTIWVLNGSRSHYRIRKLD